MEAEASEVLTLTPEEYMSNVTTTTRLSETDRKAKVQEYINLRNGGATVGDACDKVELARDTIYKWAKTYGFGDLTHRKDTTTKRRRKRTKPEPTVTNIVYPPTTTETRQPPRQTTTAPRGKVMVIVGDAESVKEALSAALGILN